MALSRAGKIDSSGPGEGERSLLPRVRAEYQPIVDLVDGGTVGYESLVRGAAGGPLQSPDELFAWARSQDRLAEFDWACRTAALTGALEQGMARGSALFVNVEPATLRSRVPSHFHELAEQAGAAGLRVVVEITERTVGADPASLLAAADRIRGRGWAVAMDDVGAEPGSLALMPLVAPEVIKLDLRLVQESTSVEIARIVNAVNAQTARTGALVLAEGIETPDQHELALAMGAHLGQGWLHGRPGAIVPEGSADLATLLTPSSMRRGFSSPWALVRDRSGIRRARKPFLAAMSRHLEIQALAGGNPAATLVLGAFQHARYFTPTVSRHYEKLARSSFLTAALARSMPREPAPGVRGQSLDPEDPMVQEWTIVVVSSHFAAALIAHDVGDRTDEGERRFDYLLSYDRDLVLDAASCMLRRLDPEPAGGAAPPSFVPPPRTG